jgi:hypothetical protein
MFRGMVHFELSKLWQFNPLEKELVNFEVLVRWFVVIELFNLSKAISGQMRVKVVGFGFDLGTVSLYPLL